ncbi:N-methylglutamate dehydrogenase subunit D [Mesorhizobium loti]|uniref:N-methylglutamate dehydrogenase subunit D n=1 Tax=Rhizobium loti TaxID=381 RepID=A0A8E3B2A0_RHILI|nr:sarcosine oxidase [Mesorhizobium loti]PWJ87437.1 N-methylglutamate dehydrogenase subunit D [Mesorhizobium loti]
MGAIARSPFAHRLTGASQTPQNENVVIRDLSTLPRIGFKGNGTTKWLSSKVSAVPDVPNKAIALSDGSLIARLGKEEYLVLPDPDAVGNVCSDLEASWNADDASGERRIGYPLPRADSHSWLHLEGRCIAQMMAKICGVDLRRDRLLQGEVVQTVVARISAVLIREMKDGPYGLHMLTDFASADYLWDVLQDASTEFGGGFSWKREDLK